MLHKKSLLVMFVLFSPVVAQQSQKFADAQVSQWQAWANNLPSMTFSALTGAMTGGLCGALVHELREYVKKNKDLEFLFPLIMLSSFVTEANFRNTLVNDMQQDFDANGLQNNKTLMSTSAWFASWFAFLKCVQMDRVL